MSENKKKRIEDLKEILSYYSDAGVSVEDKIKKVEALNRLSKVLSQRIGENNSASVSIKEIKEKVVSEFFERILSDLEFAQGYKSSKEVREHVNEITTYSDFVQLQFERETFLEKLMRSKKKPKIVYLKEKEEIFNQLVSKEEVLQLSFSNYLSGAISGLERSIKSHKQSIRFMRQNKKLKQRQNVPSFQDDCFHPEQLALVHVTRYKPLKNEEGCYVLRSLADATNLETPRNTLHFTIGHYVNSHLSGNWDDCPYVLIVPMEEMIKKNGLPMGISLVDTFFEVGLNEPLVLPKSTHFMELRDKEFPKGYPWVTQGNRTVYNNISDKRRILSNILSQMGRIEFSSWDEYNEGKKIAEMGKKMGVHSSSGAVLHSVIAIFGSNRMLEPIWKVVDTVKAMTAVFSGAKLSKKELRGFNYLKKRSEELDSSDNEEEVRYPAEEFIDIPKYLESLKEISNLDAFFQKNASCRCGPFVDKPLAMSTKEKEVFDAWKKHYQKQIDFLMEKANSMTSENKMSSISQLKNIARKNR